MSVRTVVADPPWSPSLGSTWATATTDKARPQKHYSTLTLAGIEAHRPDTASQAHLWLWCLNQHVDWGYQIARAWGFEPVNMLTWCKPGLGVGRFQCNTEQVLLCRKGSRHGNPFGHTGGTWFTWARGRHSEKPDEFYRLVEAVSPGPYLEMYARRQRPGWSAWGNEVRPVPVAQMLAFANETPNSARVAPEGGLAIPGSAGQATASNSLPLVCSGDERAVDTSALGSAEDAPAREGASPRRATRAGAHQPKEQQR